MRPRPLVFSLLLFVSASYSKQLDELNELLRLSPSEAFEYASRKTLSYKDVLSDAEIGNLVFVVETSQRMRTPNTHLIRDEAVLALLRVCVRSSRYRTLVIMDGNGKEYLRWSRADGAFDDKTTRHIINLVSLNPFVSDSVVPGIQAAIGFSKANRVNELKDLVYVIGDGIDYGDKKILKDVKALEYSEHIYFDFYSMNPIYRHEFPKYRTEEAFKHRPHRIYRVVMQHLKSKFRQIEETTADKTVLEIPETTSPAPLDVGRKME